MRNLGMPDDAPLWFHSQVRDLTGITQPLPKADAWQRGHRLEFIGLYVSDVVERRWPVLEDPAYTGIMHVQLWRVRAYRCDTPLWWEMLWQPERGHRVSLRGVERLARLKDIDKMKPSLRYVQGLLDRRGRPAKATTTEEEAKRERRNVKKAIRRKLVAGEAYNRQDIELFLYGEEQGGKFLAERIAPAKYSQLEAEVLRGNCDLEKVKRRNVRQER